jgi:hypothetical protein
MTFKYEELVSIENELGRVVGAARTINPHLHQLAQACFIIAEVRQAASVLAMPYSNDLQERQEQTMGRERAVERLVKHLFYGTSATVAL